MAEQEDAPPPSGHRDPVGESPWAMQLVVRYAKGDPPTRTAVCEAAATAVVRLLADPRAGSDWAEQVSRWQAGRIRKHVRRTTGGRWDRVAGLPGVTVEHAGAVVRALVPGPVEALPEDVARCQMSGSEPPDPFPARWLDPVLDGPVVVSLPPEPFLPLGKAAAACGHAAQLAMLAMRVSDPVRLADWAADGFPVTVEQPAAEQWAGLLGRTKVRVVDAGLTVVEPGTTTALADWA